MISTPIRSGIFLFLFVAVLVPLTTFAQVLISEIMYDAPGADTGKEWIEIQNTSASPISLTGWKLNEQGVNHTFKVVQGTTTLVAGEYAIIASDPQKFRIDWPNFSGTILDSSFSLSNTGETFSIKNGSAVIVDQVSYNSSQGASGDGESLQRFASSWSPAISTPGAGNTLRHVTPVTLPVAPMAPATKKTNTKTSLNAPMSGADEVSSASNAMVSSVATTYIPSVTTKVTSTKWFLLLGFVVVLGIFTYWIGGRKKRTEGELTAHDFTIIEEKDDHQDG